MTAGRKNHIEAMIILEIDADPIYILLLIPFTMQTVDKLFTNTTNRQPIKPQPYFHFPIRNTHSHFSFIHAPNPQLKQLSNCHDALILQIQQAQQQQRIMEQLFNSLAKAEKGQAKLTKKMQRRCNKDILDRFYCNNDNCKRFYSSQTSLQRHVKIKHHSGRREPPQPFRDLPPEPNLTKFNDSEEERHSSIEMKGGETTNNRELT